MAETPTGILSLPLTNLQTVIANCASFQTWVDADTVEEAKAKIYVVAVDGDDFDRPFALIGQGDEWGSMVNAGGARNWFQDSGSLQLMFEADIKEAYRDKSHYKDAELEFTNPIGAILKDMKTISALNTYLAITEFRKKAGPMRSDPDEKATEGDYYQIVFDIMWGI